MRKAALLYNPLSGRYPKRRLADVNLVLEIFRSAGVDCSASPTTSGAGTVDQARQAIADGYDTIFACGGDGTIHDVLQALVGTQVTLGVIPLGTANTLAHDLRIPLTAADAARRALRSNPKRLAAGQICFQNFSGHRDSRYFTVAAGVGVDAHLFYKLNVLMKGSLGMLAYYLQATHLWLTYDMRTFGAKISLLEAAAQQAGGVQCHDVSQLLAVRISNFGGVLRELAPGASLDQDDLRLVLFKTQNRFYYLAHILRGLFGQRWSIPRIELTNAKQVACAGASVTDKNARIFVEADGELLGTLPAEISIVPDAFTLLMPPPATK